MRVCVREREVVCCSLADYCTIDACVCVGECMVRVCVRERERDSVCRCTNDAGLLYHRFVCMCVRVSAGSVCA